MEPFSFSGRWPKGFGVRPGAQLISRFQANQPDAGSEPRGLRRAARVVAASSRDLAHHLWDPHEPMQHLQRIQE